MHMILAAASARRRALVTFAGVTAVGLILAACTGPKPQHRVSPFTTPMPVLPVLQPTLRTATLTTYDLTAQIGMTAFVSVTPGRTYGYNGALLGPTIRVRRGEHVAVRVHNQLDQPTNVHWHGLRLPAAADGPHNDIQPGGSFTAEFPVIQPAATLWYHPHTGNSGFQVNMGLAGLLYLEDEESDRLKIPRDYGIDDFPLLIHDRAFYPDGRVSYVSNRGDDDRMVGDHFLVNGVVNPYLEVPRGMVRLRLVNGSNARRYDFAFEDGRLFHVIASDGGILPAPVPVRSLMLSAAERAEILVDFSADAVGGATRLVSLRFPAFKGEIGPIGSSVAVGNPFPILELRVTRPGSTTGIPERLTPVETIPESAARTTRTFRMEDAGQRTINGMLFDMHRVDLRTRSDATEIWKITNDAKDFAHTFHVHGIQFRVLDRTSAQGRRPLPAIDTGWKDTIVVDPDETVRIIGRFHDLSGLYMFHCHVLEHEDLGMMGTFFVTPARR